MIAISKFGARCWRQNVGVGWVGQVHKITRAQRIAVGPGDVVIRNARPLHAGLCPGSSDVLSIVPVKIGSQHLDTTVGVFGAVEFKTEDGRATDEQKNFLEQINGLGGLAGIATCPEDAVKILSKLSK